MPEESAEDIREKLKNMSPEELRDFQKKNCIFCHIIANKVQSKKVYEDEQVIAILDINPGNPGHILLLPKEHFAIMPQMPDEIVRHMGMISKHLSKILIRSLKAEGTTIFIANGVAAGQKAQHFMLHIIPRMSGDGLDLNLSHKEMPDELLMKLKKAVQPNLYRTLGIEFKPEKEDHVEVQKPAPVKAAEISQPVPEQPEEDIMFALSGEDEKTGSGQEPETHSRAPEKKPSPKRQASRDPAPEKKKNIDLDDIANLFG